VFDQATGASTNAVTDGHAVTVTGITLEKWRIVAFFVLSILIVSITRLPFVPSHLHSFDEVNLALALKNFDPTRNQPQPPGYPLFVFEERLLNALLGTPERTFAVLSCLIGGLAVASLYLLGRRMFSSWVGLTAAALLFVNPIFWFSGLTSPLRPHLALISVLMAYFCWRATNHEPQHFIGASVTLGLGSGFRPELLLFLFPLWAWTAWQCRDRVLILIRGLFLLIVTTLVWVVVLVIASGGWAPMLYAFSNYLFAQTQQTSVLLDPRSGSWMRWAGRAILWTGLGVVPWIWTLPFGWVQRRELPERNKVLSFLVAWFLPAFVFYLIVHIGDPDQALTIIPALCLAGAFCLVSGEQFIARKWLPDLKEERGFLVGIALLGNLLLFFGQFPLPQRTPASSFRGLQSVEDAVLIGTYETSYARVLWVEQMMNLAIEEIQGLKSTANRPVLFIWARDGEPVWRKITYYLPTEKVYELDEKGALGAPFSLAQLWQSNVRLQKYSGDTPIRVPLPKGTRLIWVIASAYADELGRLVPLQKAGSLYFTDLSRDAPSFRWGSFELAPE